VIPCIFYPKLIDNIKFTKNLHEELVDLQRDKACGPDSIQPTWCWFHLCLEFFNFLLTQGHYLETAKIVPVHKKAINASNLTIVSLLVKVMERIIRHQIIDVQDSHKLISECQHGFCNKFSTVLPSFPSLLMTGQLALNDITLFTAFYLTLLRLAPHRRLLIRLESLRIHGNLLSWFNSFLTKWYQRVVPVRSGIPQGSVLGPLLFLLYADELRKATQHSNIKLFADDIAL